MPLISHESGNGSAGPPSATHGCLLHRASGGRPVRGTGVAGEAARPGARLNTTLKRFWGKYSQGGHFRMAVATRAVGVGLPSCTPDVQGRGPG